MQRREFLAAAATTAAAGLLADRSSSAADAPASGREYYDLRTYHFASAEHKAAFDKDSAKYAPQFGGYCAWAVSKNSTAKIDLNHFFTLHVGAFFVF